MGAGEVVRHLRAAATLAGGERLATWELAAAREATAALAESARDVLQQAAERADALEMPTLAADAGRLLGATAA